MADVKPTQAAEVTALRSALKTLMDACYQADRAEELSEQIDGSMIDAARDALELQYPIIWSEADVARLQAHQDDPKVHPYTCGGDRTDAAHAWHERESGDRDAGLLIPTARGWICPVCDYRQFWAHGIAAFEPLAAAPEAERGDEISLREAARDLLRAMHDGQQHVGYRLDLWNVLQACLDQPAAIRALPVGEGEKVILRGAGYWPEDRSSTDTPARPDIKAQARDQAEEWLRAISTWLLETDNDMRLPTGVLDSDPLDIADRLGGWVRHDGSAEPPNNWCGGSIRLISGEIIKAPKLTVRWARVEAYIPGGEA